MSELVQTTVGACSLESRPIRYRWEDDIENLDKILHKQQFKIDKTAKYIKRKAWRSKHTVSKGHRYE